MKWRLSLNPKKCFLIQFNPRSQQRSFKPIYFIDGIQIARKTHGKDLGIVMSEDCKFYLQVNKACRKAHWEINRIRRTFISRKPTFIANMYKLYVRPHLEYCVEVWNPKDRGNVVKMEKIQNKMSRMLRSSNHLNTEERNKVLGITSHEQRRLRGDMINIYKNIDKNKLFILRNNAVLRGNIKTICIPLCD